MRSSSVPARFADKRLVDFVPGSSESARKALEAADEFVGGAISGLVLVGLPGTGKTHIAAGIVNAIRARAQEDYAKAAQAAVDTMPRLPVLPIWANVADLIVELRLDMDRPKDDRLAVAMAADLRLHRGLAVLDDLGREKTSDWTAETIYSIVNARYEDMLPTIVTSNLRPEELLSGPYGQAVSRIAEDGRLIALRDLPDHRLASAKARS